MLAISTECETVKTLALVCPECIFTVLFTFRCSQFTLVNISALTPVGIEGKTNITGAVATSFLIVANSLLYTSDAVDG